MIVFELTMPHCGSWNGRWSGERERFIRVRREDSVPKDRVGRNYFYRWDDGWEACVSVSSLPAKEAKKLEKISSGFSTYDWMIKSIIEHGEIKND